MIRTKATIVISAPPAAVYALLDDPHRAAELTSNQVEVLDTRELPDGGRATRIRTHLPNGALAQTESVVVERVRDKRIVVLSTTSPFGFAPTRRWRFGSIATRAERTLEAHPDGTLLAVASEYRITPAVLRLYFTFVKRGQWQRATDDWLERLRSMFTAPSGQPR
jgi:Polyketide cyclase / dehydrase and lipid transport